MGIIHLPGELRRRQPQRPVEIDWNNPLTVGLLEAHTPQSRVYEFAGNAVLRPEQQGIGFSMPSATQPPRISSARLMAGLNNSTSLAVFSTRAATTALSGRPFYSERSESNDIYKWGLAASTTTSLGFVFRNSAGNLINNATTVPIDTTRSISVGAFITTGTASRTIYCDRSFATNTSNFANSFTAANDRRICGDSQDLATHYSGAVLAIMLWNRSLSIAELDELSNNPWQLFKPQPRRIWLASATGGVDLAGTASANAAATGSLTHDVPLAGAGLSVATGSGALSVSINLTGDATAQANASGGLSLSVPLNGDAIAQALASAGITQGVPLTGSAAGQATSSASISLDINLSGTAIAEAAAAAGLTVTTSGLAGNAQAQASASAALSISIPLTGAALTVSGADGSLTQIVPLAGSAAAASLATGGLDVSISLAGAALAQALATGAMTLRVNLDGAAVASAIASGALASDGALSSTPGWSIAAPKRTWGIATRPRAWNIAAPKRTWSIAT